MGNKYGYNGAGGGARGGGGGFDMNSIMKQANAKVLAAWQEGKPNLPPRRSFTRCTMSAISGLREGRGRSNIGRSIELHVWSAITISRPNITAVKIAIRGLKLRHSTYRIEAYKGIHTSLPVNIYMNESR